MEVVSKPLFWPVLGSVSVLVLSAGLVWVTGQELFDLAVVLGLLILFWALTRLSRREIGLRWGHGRAYLVALIYPVILIGALGLAAWLSGNADPRLADPAVGRRVLLMFVNTLIGALITEEGFFRGWLWGALEKAQLRPVTVLVWSSFVFCLWHVPVATMEPSFRLSAALIPIYLANVFLLGMAWGILRAASGSILVASFCHAVWNALVYVLFGFGERAGALGIQWFGLFDPERGLGGLLLNVLVLVLLWKWWKGRFGDRI